MAHRAKIKGPFAGLRRRLRILFYGAGRYEHWMIMVLAVITGIVCGYGAIAFYKGIGLFLELFFGAEESILASHVRTLPWYQIILTTVTGGLIVGQLLRFLPQNRTTSVSDVIETAALHNGKTDLKTGLISAVATVLTLGSGGSAGREGPVVHLGATLSSAVTRLFRLNPKVGRTLLGCGVAASVAASFNAPLAGVFFAMEIIIGHYALHTFTPIVISAIVGTLISRIYLGDFPAFAIHDTSVVSALEFPAFFLLGIVAALVAVMFMASMSWGDQLRNRIKRIPYWLQPAIGGVFIGAIGIFFPEILSVGYEATSKALQNSYGFIFLILLLVAKIAATTITLASRFGGGVFSPSLFLGAMTGSAFGIIVGQVNPELASSPGIYAIVGMGAVASSVLGAPISTMLIVFEITGDYNVTIAVMIASAVASLVSKLFYRQSFFHLQLANRGIHLEGGRPTYLLKSASVAAHMTRDFFTVKSSEPLETAKELLIAQGGGVLIVTDGAGLMTGILSFSEIPTHLRAEDGHTLTAGEVGRDIPLTVRATDPLQLALSRLEHSGEDMLPVISSEQKGLVVGIIRHRDVIREYNRALVESQGRDQR